MLLVVPYFLATSSLRRDAVAPSHSLFNAFAGARICARALAARGQVALVAQPAIRANFNQPLDVELHLSAQIAFHTIFFFNNIAQNNHFGLGQVLDPP